MDEFNAPQDRLVQTTTVLTIILFSALFLVFASTNNSYGLSLLVIIGLPLLVLCYLFAPTGYAISESEIIIHRKIQSVRIPLSEVKSVRQDPQACPLWGGRSFGVTGLFGYFGYHYSRRFGHYRMYVTDRSKAVVIGGNKMIVISPDDPHQFVQIAKARLELKKTDSEK